MGNERASGTTERGGKKATIFRMFARDAAEESIDSAGATGESQGASVDLSYQKDKKGGVK